VTRPGPHPGQRDRRRRFRLPLLASALSFVGLVFYLSEYWLSGRPPGLLPPPAEPLVEPAVSLYLMEPRSVSYDEQGQVSHRFHSRTLYQLEDEDRSRATLPVFTGYREDGEGWVARALEGEIRHLAEDDEITLIHDVHVDNLGGNRSLRTTVLTLYPGRKHAETDAAVRLAGPGSITDGVGMRADLAADRVKLLHQVRGHHDAH